MFYRSIKYYVFITIIVYIAIHVLNWFKMGIGLKEEAAANCE